MAVIYVAGSAPGVGKTGFATAIARSCIDKGQSVGIIKPLIISPSSKTCSAVDEEVQYYKKIVPGNPDFLHRAINITDPPEIQQATLTDSIDAINATSRDYDTLIIEGLDGLDLTHRSTEISMAVVAGTNAQVITLVNPNDTLTTSTTTASLNPFGDKQIGVIINQVPRYQMRSIETDIRNAHGNSGYKILGVLPEDRLMLSPTVQQLANHLGASPLHTEYLRNQAEHTEAIVQYIMVGGWFLDKGSYVFSRRNNKAVIVRGDRPDSQMAALETLTLCLILTDGRYPVQYITYQAEQHQVPMYLVEAPTVVTLESVEGINSRINSYNSRKTDHFMTLLQNHCDLSNIG